MNVGDVVEGWEVVALRGDGAVIVARPDQPLRRRLVRSGTTSRALLVRLQDFVEHGFVEILGGGSDFWVLDDATSVAAEYVVARAEEDEPLSLEVVAAFARGMLEPLAHAHQEDVVLGRLDLQRIVVDRAGVVRLVPVDEATADAGPARVAPLSLVGLSPELVRGLPEKELTPASDVFAAASLLYRLLAGRSAHRGETPVESLRNVIDGVITAPLGVIRPGVPEALELVIEGALQPDPHRRPDGARALLEALEPHLPPRDVATAALAELVQRYEPTTPGALAPRALTPEVLRSMGLLGTPVLKGPLRTPVPATAPSPEPSEDDVPLPRALEPWKDALSLFPEDLALGLGTAVRRLARLIGTLRLDADAHSGVPDGYRGVARRGPIERLLLSEWGIAMEVPDEFIRRVAMNEQLFTALAHQRPGGVRRSIALFDAGPDALGRPRIAQLAVLIALAARAQAAGVRFAWGLVQDERRSLIAELNRASVRHLLAGRTAHPASPLDGAEWAIALGGPSEADDLWLIGPRALDGAVALGGGTRVVIEDAPDPSTRAVHVTLARPRAPARQVVLELPPEDDCARLLREPFERRAKPRAPALRGTTSPTVWMGYEPSGRRLLEVHQDGAVVATHVPRTAREQPAAPVRRAAPANGEIIGATMMGNRLLTLETREGSLVVQRVGNHGGDSGQWTLLVPPEAFAALFTGQRAAVAIEAAGKLPRRVLVLDARGELWMGTPDGVLAGLEGDVCGLHMIEHATYYATAFEDVVRLSRIVYGGKAQVVGQWPGSGQPAMALGIGAASMPGPGVAVRIDPETWMYPEVGQLPAAYGEIVGIAHDEGYVVLVALAADRRTLVLARASGPHVFHTAPRPIKLLAPNPRHRALAYYDERDALRVIDLDGRVLFARE